MSSTQREQDLNVNSSNVDLVLVTLIFDLVTFQVLNIWHFVEGLFPPSFQIVWPFARSVMTDFVSEHDDLIDLELQSRLLLSWKPCTPNLNSLRLFIVELSRVYTSCCQFIARLLLDTKGYMLPRYRQHVPATWQHVAGQLV